MGLVVLPSQLQVTGISMSITHPGQVTVTSRLTGARSTYARGYGLWSGQVGIQPAVWGDDGARLGSAFLASLEGTRHWFRLPLAKTRDYPSVASLSGLAAISSTQSDDFMVTNFSADAAALLPGYLITINNRLFEVVSGTGTSRVLSPQVPLVFPAGVSSFPVTPGDSLLVQRSGSDPILLEYASGRRQEFSIPWVERV